MEKWFLETWISKLGHINQIIWGLLSLPYSTCFFRRILKMKISYWGFLTLIWLLFHWHFKCHFSFIRFLSSNPSNSSEDGDFGQLYDGCLFGKSKFHISLLESWIPSNHFYRLEFPNSNPLSISGCSIHEVDLEIPP